MTEPGPASSPVAWHAVAAARLRVPLFVLGVLAIAGSLFLSPWLALVGIAAVAAALALYFLVGAMDRPPVEVLAPVTGRWVAVNSPSSRVPSHGLQAWGQTYAIDLVHVPEGEYAPRPGWSDGFRPPEEFPGFGRPVLAPAAGRVVRVRDGARDHASRSSWPALAWLVVEAGVRELRGPSGLLGNHVVIDIGRGHVVLAHLRRGSLTVRPGDRVEAGRQIAECGNSGNSTEPHVHMQVQDIATTAFAAGVPMAFTGVAVEGVPRFPGVPPNGSALEARASG